MKQKIKQLLCIWVILCSLQSFAQIEPSVVLSQYDFLKWVKQYHPVAKQANLLINNANANALQASGGFDPKLFYGLRSKYYNETNYYNVQQAGVTLPTWYGVEGKIGYEKNTGQFLDPENKTPANGLLYAQVSLPILQGLVIDDRRATLAKAKLFQKMSEFEKATLLNELLFNAGKSYWNWQLAYRNRQILQNAVSIAQQRFEAVKRTVMLGDRSPIDTVEASIQLQERIVSYQQADMEYATQSYYLSNFLWLENNQPVEIAEQTIPELDTDLLKDFDRFGYIDTLQAISLVKIHPELRTYQFKLQQFDIDRKLKQDKLKPAINVHYNPLFSADNFNPGNLSNYKWGVSVGFPLFLRKERGELRMAKIKMEATQLENNNKQNELVNKSKAVINQFKTYQSQYGLYEETVKNYQRLWEAEKQLFDLGESSLFLINSREMSYIQSQLKLNELLAKGKKSSLEVQYTVGNLYSNY